MTEYLIFGYFGYFVVSDTVRTFSFFGVTCMLWHQISILQCIRLMSLDRIQLISHEYFLFNPYLGFRVDHNCYRKQQVSSCAALQAVQFTVPLLAWQDTLHHFPNEAKQCECIFFCNALLTSIGAVLVLCKYLKKKKKKAHSFFLIKITR